MKLDSKKIIIKLKNKFHTIRTKLFLTLTITIAIIIGLLVVTNSIVLEKYYLYSKQEELMSAYELINDYYSGVNTGQNIEVELEKMELRNNFDILIKVNNTIYASSRDFVSSLSDELVDRDRLNENILYNSDNVTIKRVIDNKTQLSFILLSATLDNGYELYIRVAIVSIQESVEISNKFLVLIRFHSNNHKRNSGTCYI